MRRRLPLTLAPLLALTLAGCATVDTTTAEQIEAGSTAEVEADAEGVVGADAAAQAKAQAWLDAAQLPPGAAPADAGVARFSSWTGWPCGPVEELEGFWSIPGATVSDTINWLRAHPTADLISTAGAYPLEESDVQSAAIGFIPTEGAQEGVVYTVERVPDGVAVRAEVAAQTADAACPELEDGGEWGAPGQG
ncbi:hypothetical protein KZX37_06010 [Microbacterium sp. EYE_5]|uniref:hypothetical protein n=1 Tax=unclassified Microbacterium TaxID=2609290 RepID=UPI002005A97F|nr:MULTISPECIES: hypothetical protein [unclassified Microbacterium]MCK6080176.1 hypothetical protein [Microbacterium sp. EYE_382]MCK6085447.1 hypothetical protein [Microbacterium sp. EYE_384]MCK6122328.1 hypothetical protein [Microbacterium sp. EYE_80]MCK6126210.1 hypothetical protein [Microbacterium sp. EYE_79]MCK6141131.1 hypothetical protein [Microbacterium sp. EYE_39]